VTINTPGQNAELTFNGSAGQSASVLLSNSTFPGGCYSLMLSILNPDGSTLASTSMCGQGNDALSAVTLPSTGTYTVAIAPQNGGMGTTNVTLSLQ
jgi:hypothetical protein